MTSSRSPSIVYLGLDPDALREVLVTGIDHAGHPVAPFVDDAGDWPLRCCLTNSRPGDRLAIIGFSPFPWTSPYRTMGPVVVHADGCDGSDGSFPQQFERVTQILRPYGEHDGRSHSMVYDLVHLVPAEGGIRPAIEDILEDPRVEFVMSHNVMHGCYSFTAIRPGR